MSSVDDFERKIAQFHQLVVAREEAIFAESVAAVKGSIQEGSEITGAPGQPVAPENGGNLIGSWQSTFPEPWLGRVATNAVYAPAVEEGQQEPYTTKSGKSVTPRPMVFRSEVGGAHSWKLTIAGWPALADSVAQRVVSQ